MDFSDPSKEKPTKGLMSDKTFNMFLISACFALAVLVLFLAWQNRKLKEEIAELMIPQIPPTALKQGDSMEPLNFIDEAGKDTLLGFGEGKTLLLIFSPQCPACIETIPVWNDMLQEAPAATRIAGLRLAAEVESTVITRFPIYTPTDDGSGLAGRIPYIPATLLIDEHGIIEWVKYGALTDEDVETLSEILEGL
jgi:hypothetical protein